MKRFNSVGSTTTGLLLLFVNSFLVKATLREGTSLKMGILQQSRMVLPPSSPCPWDYETCKMGQMDECIGPARWGEICDGAYKRCGSGILQSPIDIDVESLLAKEYTPQARPLITMYDGSDNGVTFKNTARGLSLEGSFGKVQCGSKLSEDGAKNYEAVSVQFHSPSEHTRLGDHFPLEIQIVHRAEGTEGNEDILIVSFMFEERNEDTPPSPFLESIVDSVPSVMSERSLKNVNLNLMSGFRSSYVSYKGSITTPPCEESVQYMIMSQVQPATAAQLKVFSDATGSHGNARPTQPVAGRVVEFVDVTQFYQDQWKPSDNFTRAEMELKLKNTAPIIVADGAWE